MLCCVLIQDNKTSEEELADIPAESLWSYLCRHNLIDTIVDWINVQYFEQAARKLYYNHPITASMVDRSYNVLPVSSRVKVTQLLTRYAL